MIKKLTFNPFFENQYGKEFKCFTHKIKNHAEGVHIIKAKPYISSKRSFVYHQAEGDTRLRVMIYQACGLDKRGLAQSKRIEPAPFSGGDGEIYELLRAHKLGEKISIVICARYGEFAGKLAEFCISTASRTKRGCLKCKF